METTTSKRNQGNALPFSPTENYVGDDSTFAGGFRWEP
jgi:hypothetical protein